MFKWFCMSTKDLPSHRVVPTIAADGTHAWSIESALYGMEGAFWIERPYTYKTKEDAEAAVKHLEGNKI